jgi:hypothetical protein
MLNPLVDKLNTTNSVIAVILGSVFFPLHFYVIVNLLKNTSFGASFCKKYSIKQHGIYDISNKIISSVFSIISCMCGLAVITKCTSNDLMKERHLILENFMIFGFPYFFYDMYSMYLITSTENKDNVTVSTSEIIQFLKTKPLIILHHILVPGLGYSSMLFLRNGQGDCLLGYVFLMEASTPFVSMRVILCHLQLRRNLIYVANGLAMLATFFFCRILIFPYMFYLYSNSIGESVWSTVTSLHWYCNAGSLLLTLPQLYWFTKMVQGSGKIVSEFLQNKYKRQ